MQTAIGRLAQEFEDGLQAALPRQQRLIQLKLSVTKLESPRAAQCVGAREEVLEEWGHLYSLPALGRNKPQDPSQGQSQHPVSGVS